MSSAVGGYWLQLEALVTGDPPCYRRLLCYTPTLLLAVLNTLLLQIFQTPATEGYCATLLILFLYTFSRALLQRATLLVLYLFLFFLSPATEGYSANTLLILCYYATPLRGAAMKPCYHATTYIYFLVILLQILKLIFQIPATEDSFVSWQWHCTEGNIPISINFCSTAIIHKEIVRYHASRMSKMIQKKGIHPPKTLEYRVMDEQYCVLPELQN